MRDAFLVAETLLVPGSRRPAPKLIIGILGLLALKRSNKCQLSDDQLGTGCPPNAAGELGRILLGRKTYEIFAAYWPTATDDFAAVKNGMTKYVASRSLDTAQWQNSTVLKGDVPTEVAKLKEAPGKDISVIGSGNFAQTLIKHDLVDEYQLMIHPVVVGNGKRLFNDVSDGVGLVLVDSKTTSTGTLLLTYRPALSDADT